MYYFLEKEFDFCPSWKLWLFVHWHWSASIGLSLPLFQQWKLEQLEMLKDTLDGYWDTKQGSCLIHNAGGKWGKVAY